MEDAARVYPNLRIQGTGHHFRRRVPKPLVARLKRHEVVFSLRTACPRQAALRARAVFLATERAFREMTERPSLTPEQCHALVAAWLRRSLWEWEEAQARRDAPGTPGAPDWNGIHRMVVATCVPLYGQALADNDLGMAERTAAEIAALAGVPFDIGEPGARLLARTVLRAWKEAYEEIGRRADGLFPPLSQDAPSGTAAAAPAAVAPPPKETRGILFSEGYQRHEADMCGPRAAPQKPWKVQTRRQNAMTAALWIEFCGDRPVDTYTRDEAVAFKRALEEPAAEPREVGERRADHAGGRPVRAGRAQGPASADHRHEDGEAPHERHVRLLHLADGPPGGVRPQGREHLPELQIRRDEFRG